MMNLRKNLEVYRNEEYERWSKNNLEGLSQSEYAFIRKHMKLPGASILEAGAGGGRISFALEDMGFRDIHAFDVVEDMIAHLQKTAKAQSSRVNAFVANASSLSDLQTCSYDYVLYLTQVLCFIEDANERACALKEAYRVLKPGGIGVFSFLLFEGRVFNYVLAPVLFALRKLRKENLSVGYMPWLRSGGKPNMKMLHGNQAVCYWYHRREIVEALSRCGFIINDVQTDRDLRSKRSLGSGMLYVACHRE